MKPWSVVIKDGHPFGLLAGIAIPPDPAPVPTEILDRLHPDERSYAEGLRGFHQVQWVGGRLAAAVATRLLGRQPGPVLPDARGVPCCRGPVALSITHKRTLAMALAARPELGSVGIDLEDLAPARMMIAGRVLTLREQEAVAALPPVNAWTGVLIRFSLKEAIYKALAPRLARYIDFQEAEVEPDPSGLAQVTLRLTEGEPPSMIEARYSWMEGRVLSAVRAQWTS